MNRFSWLSSFSLACVVALTGCGDRAVFGLGDTGVRHDAGADAHGDDGGRRDTGMPSDDDAATGTDAAMRDGGGVVTADGGHDAAMAADAGAVVLGDGAMLFDAAVLGDGAARDGGTADASRDGGPHLGPAPVILGPTTDLSRAGAYALIGKTGITNVTGSLISGGHLGVSPEFSPALTGFALILDPSGQFSTSVSVAPPWRVYAADYAVPTPTNLTSAILDMQGAYTDAASRVLPDFLNLVDGHIGGLVLVPGLYAFGSSVDVTAGLTFVGGADDVWILQVQNDVDLSAATGMVLAGGARASNIFWQVAGQVTIHAGAHFEGVILCQTGITMQTGASMHGRALAQTLVALDDNAITAP